MGKPRRTSESVAEIFITIYGFILLHAAGAGFVFLLGVDFIANHTLLTPILAAIVGWGCIFLLHLPYPFGGLIVVTLMSALSTFGLYTVLALYCISDRCLLIVLSVLFFLFCFTGGFFAYYAKENMYL